MTGVVTPPQFLTIAPDGCGGDFICVGMCAGEEPMMNPRADVSIRFVTALMGGYYRPSRGQSASIDGDVLRIEREGRTAVYRLGRYMPDAAAYEARWPD